MRKKEKKKNIHRLMSLQFSNRFFPNFELPAQYDWLTTSKPTTFSRNFFYINIVTIGTSITIQVPVCTSVRAVLCSTIKEMKSLSLWLILCSTGDIVPLSKSIDSVLLFLPIHVVTNINIFASGIVHTDTEHLYFPTNFNILWNRFLDSVRAL